MERRVLWQGGSGASGGFGGGGLEVGRECLVKGESGGDYLASVSLRRAKVFSTRPTRLSTVGTRVSES